MGNQLECCKDNSNVDRDSEINVKLKREIAMCYLKSFNTKVKQPDMICNLVNL
jgi:hypothetical protein